MKPPPTNTGSAKRRIYALSIKQPWAALLVHGRKTIEVRRWPTARRGRVLIHAGRVADHRPEAWARVPDELVRATRQLGGIVGVAELTDCKSYRSPAAFAADRDAHLNDPAWFQEPALYGFMFAHAEVVPFRACPGWVRFFRVDEVVPEAAE